MSECELKPVPPLDSGLAFLPFWIVGARLMPAKQLFVAGDDGFRGPSICNWCGERLIARRASKQKLFCNKKHMGHYTGVMTRKLGGKKKRKWRSGNDKPPLSTTRLCREQVDKLKELFQSGERMTFKAAARFLGVSRDLAVHRIMKSGAVVVDKLLTRYTQGKPQNIYGFAGVDRPNRRKK